MSRPILDFSLDSLNFQNKFLSHAASQAKSVASPTVLNPPIFNDNEKSVNLSSGKKITLKKKQKRDKPELTLESIQEKHNYGFTLNELFAKLEVQRLKDQSTEESYIKKSCNDILWAEKWRPKDFLDFVGNEATNRKILRWMKQWDRVVYEKNFKPITSEDTKDSNSYGFQDPFGRPQRKILLIHGPPGLGKTTVAHVIAKQAGYEVMEINASDERSGQRIKDKVTNSLTSLTFSGKPVCLIADEVDGAAEFGFIKVLSDIINDDYKTIRDFQKTESSRFWSQTGKNKPRFLLRPIVAICNDLYAPALEKIRMQAEVITFQQASEKALRDRLKFICDAEKLFIPSKQLKEIIQLTSFDIRSCLNILQFGGDLNNSNDLRKKDSQISWFAIVNDIFRRDPKMTKGEQFKELTEIMQTNSNYDKIIHGLFQSYHDVHYQDIGLSKPAMISDWLYFSDIMGKTQYEAIGNLSYYSCQVALQFFNQFGDLTNRNNIKIKSDYEYFERRKTNQNLMKLIFGKTNPSLRCISKLSHLSFEMLPFLDYIIVPERKTLAALKDYELAKLHNAIDVIQGFGLYMNKAKDENFNEIYKTYPEFTSITKFEPINVKRQQQRQTQVFPTLLKEMDAIKAKKRAFSRLQDEGMTSSQTNGEAGIQSLRHQYDKLAETEQIAKRQKTTTQVKIWVKYHEGFSNAVRKNVKWSNLWQ